MGQTEATVTIITGKAQYFIGECLSGKISVSVNSQTVSAKKLVLDFYGEEFLQPIEGGLFERHEFYHHQIVVAEFTQHLLMKGRHEYEFCISLPFNLRLPTMSITNLNNHGSCHISYFLIATLEGSKGSFFSKDISHQLSLTIYPLPIQRIASVRCGPFHVDFQSYYEIIEGEADIGLQIPSKYIQQGEEIIVSYLISAEETSQLLISYLEFEIVQEVISHDHHDNDHQYSREQCNQNRSKQTLFHLQLPYSQISFHSRRSSRNELLHSLNTYEHTVIMKIPEFALISFHGTLISTRHQLWMKVYLTNGNCEAIYTHLQVQSALVLHRQKISAATEDITPAQLINVADDSLPTAAVTPSTQTYPSNPRLAEITLPTDSFLVPNTLLVTAEKIAPLNFEQEVLSNPSHHLIDPLQSWLTSNRSDQLTSQQLTSLYRICRQSQLPLLTKLLIQSRLSFTCEEISMIATQCPVFLRVHIIQSLWKKCRNKHQKELILIQVTIDEREALQKTLQS